MKKILIMMFVAVFSGALAFGGLAGTAQGVAFLIFMVSFFLLLIRVCVQVVVR